MNLFENEIEFLGEFRILCFWFFLALLSIFVIEHVMELFLTCFVKRTCFALTKWKKKWARHLFIILFVFKES